MMTSLELLLAYRRLNEANSNLVAELAKLVCHGANTGLDNIDSQVLLEILQKHNETVRKINRKFLEESDANTGISKQG